MNTNVTGAGTPCFYIAILTFFYRFGINQNGWDLALSKMENFQCSPLILLLEGSPILPYFIYSLELALMIDTGQWVPSCVTSCLCGWGSVVAMWEVCEGLGSTVLVRSESVTGMWYVWLSGTASHRTTTHKIYTVHQNTILRRRKSIITFRMLSSTPGNL